MLRFEREPELMERHRTTARGILLLLAVAALTAGGAAAARAPGAAVPPLIFPVVGPSSYTNDYGAPRGQGRHDGVDVMAPKRALAVAVEAGTVKFWTTSWRAGCMLYLYGASGTTYLYVHLNNDRTRRNDNRGGCVPGVAFFPGLKSGAKVAAGDPIGYVGDSGDADGIASHLHFEVHPRGRGSINPFPHLRRARPLLFAAKRGTTFKLTLRGTIARATDGELALRVDRLRRFPGGLNVPKIDRTVRLAVPPAAVVFDPVGAVIAQARLNQARPGQPATVWTEAARATLAAQLGAPNVLSAERIALAGQLPGAGIG